MLKVYKPKTSAEPERPDPELALCVVDGEIQVNAVNPTNGEWIAHLFTSGQYGLRMDIGAKGAIHSTGFTTNWAEWDGSGGLIRMKGPSDA